MTLVMRGLGISPGLGGGNGIVVENVTVELDMAQYDVTLVTSEYVVTLDAREEVTLEDRNIEVEVCD